MKFEDIGIIGQSICELLNAQYMRRHMKYIPYNNSLESNSYNKSNIWEHCSTLNLKEVGCQNVNSASYFHIITFDDTRSLKKSRVLLHNGLTHDICKTKYTLHT